MRSLWMAVGVALTMGLLVAEASAEEDLVRGSHFELSEVRHRIHVVLDRGHARLTVERSFYNPGDRPDQLRLLLELPHRAVATGLRTLGTLSGRPHWFEGQLVDAPRAEAAYQNLTNLGGYPKQPPALLSLVDDGYLELRAFPCPPKQNKVVAYTVELPLTYRNGRYVLPVEPLGIKGQLATYTFQAARAGDTVLLGDQPLLAGTELTPKPSTPDSEALVVSLLPAPSVGIDGELAVVDTGAGRSYAHLGVVLGPEISQVPEQATVVLGLDNSRSMRAGRGSIVALAAATLGHFRGAQVQILDFSRTPNPRFPGFVDKAVALAALEAEMSGGPAPEPGNGSEVALALAEAARLVTTAPEDAAKRILFFTDALVPPRITPGRVAASIVGTDAIVHLVQAPYRPERGWLHRDDDHPWAIAARMTGGLAWKAENDGVGTACLELVRPTRLDYAIYRFSAGEDKECGVLDLAQGRGFEHDDVFDGAVRSATLEGELWSQPFLQTLYPDPKATKKWSTLLFGRRARHGLSEAEMGVLARRGRAVTEVTSYLSVEPGVRPSVGRRGWVSLRSESPFGSGHGRLIGSHKTRAPRFVEGPFDPQAYLAERLSSIYAKCGGTPGTVEISVETHFVEIAEVTITRASEAPTLDRCLREGIWALDLRTLRFADPRRVWTIGL
jgi:hypothetical protein